MDQLKLSSQQFPFTLSLQPLVMTEFGRQAPDGEPMSREELFNYLTTIEDFEAGPLQAVQAQTEVVGEPAVPTPEDHAALAWVGAAFDHWERTFHLEPAVAEKLRQMKPVLAIIALADEQFYVPGLHPLHQALDAICDAAVGWQQDLGRAGEPLLKLIDQAVEGATACLADNGTGLMNQLRASAKSAKRFESRTRRMAQRTADIERGQLRATRAKESAAAMINAQTARHPIPLDIGEFMNGPWFESAQLVLLKYSEKSPQWQEVCAATAELMTAMAPEKGTSPNLEAGSQVVKDIRKWLLSLQHDEQLTGEVINEVEFTCLRVLKGAELERTKTRPIPTQNSAPQNDQNSDLTALEVGDWFQLELRKNDVARMQLAMTLPAEQRLLFCNQAGAKPHTMDYADFNRLMREGKIQRLDTGASFSRSLATVAGIDSLQALAELTGRPLPDARPATLKASDGQTTADIANFQSPPPQVKAATPGPANEQIPVSAATAARPDSRSAQPASRAAELPPVQVDQEKPSKPNLPDGGIPELPMGTWLGFHDLDPPLLAKLAMHDKVRRLLIFVNRKGIELRRLQEDEYLALLQQGEVDILETSTNFREQVERARKRMARHQPGST